MKETIKAVHNPTSKDFTQATLCGVSKARVALGFHQSMPGYAPTPLVALPALAQALGIGGFYVKDESYRFGLNAFKVLGGSFALASYVAQRLGKRLEDLDFADLTDPQAKETLGPLTFVTATDGNHGRGVAWMAQALGQRAVVYMPKGSSLERLHHIQEAGAEAAITQWNYDDTVAFAALQAKEQGWILIQDTAWEGYEEVPAHIMQGYTTMGMEMVQQLDSEEIQPTHVFLQAGVGAMAGAMTAFLTDYYQDKKPVITIVEPNQADCLYRSALAGEPGIQSVTGDMATIMAGLACGVPCTLGWQQLRQYAEHFVSLPDWVAAKGMRILGNPLGKDSRIISGESGAVPAGFVAEVLQNESLGELKDTLGLREDSVVVCISTEGDTDQENYRRIVWDGLHPSF